MNSYRKLKAILYVSMTLLGVYLIAAGQFGGWQIADQAARFSAAALTFVGVILILFGFTTFLIRTDEDVWR